MRPILRRLALSLLIVALHAAAPVRAGNYDVIEQTRCFVRDASGGILSCISWDARVGRFWWSLLYTENTRARTYPPAGRIVCVQYRRETPSELYDWWNRCR